MRLIDADAMCADLATVDPRYKAMIEWGVRVTEAQPTVDAVEVVRCKDCKFSRPFTEEELKAEYRVGEWHCAFWYAEMHKDDYCSCGERREDER